MKTLLIVMISCGICAASQVPRQIRVSLQYVEVRHSDMSALLAGTETGGKALHAKAMDLCKQGNAKILETCVLVCRSGNKATTQSVREEIYPTEYPGTLQWTVPPTPEQLASVPPANPMLRSIMAFETRNTGVTFEVEPVFGLDDHLIDLRIIPEVVTPVRLDTWMEHTDQWGDASFRMPVYETWRTRTALILQSGKFELASVITPKHEAPAPAVSRRILVFVRADIIPVPIESP
jgi:hypothetical protein